MTVTTPATIITTAKSCSSATPCMPATFGNQQMTGQEKPIFLGNFPHRKVQSLHQLDDKGLVSPIVDPMHRQQNHPESHRKTKVATPVRA